jgi:hypothetical protein
MKEEKKTPDEAKSNMGDGIRFFQYGRVWCFIDLIEASERNFS